MIERPTAPDWWRALLRSRAEWHHDIADAETAD